jgi:hypothetical protein
VGEVIGELCEVKKSACGERTWAVRKPGGFLKVIPTVIEDYEREERWVVRRGKADF